MQLTEEERAELLSILAPYLSDEEVCLMHTYIQHGNITTFQHCMRVAVLSMLLERRLHLSCDEKSLAIGAFLHDFYLYDWHTDNPYGKRHGFVHPELARQNAVRRFGISEKQQSIIRSHMWPMTLRHPPQCIEGWLVTVADKYCSLEETLFMRK